LLTLAYYTFVGNTITNTFSPQGATFDHMLQYHLTDAKGRL